MQNNSAAHRLNPEDITWTREVEPRETYRILYLDMHGEKTTRTIELLRIGHNGLVPYLGAMHDGRFKTFRSDRVLEVLEQLTSGHEPSIHSAITYSSKLPAWPLTQTLFRVETTAKSNRQWTVDLSAYTCTCPEKRIRSAKGYKPGQVGFVCPHMARAILKFLPKDEANWTSEMLSFLSNPAKVHIENLVACNSGID